MHTHSQDHNVMATAPFGATSEPTRPHIPPSRELTVNDILQRIDLLIEETAYLRESVEALGKIESEGSGDPHSPGDIGAQAKAMALASVVEQREHTNRDMITLLARMFEDLSQRPVTMDRPRTNEELKLIERLIDQSPEMSDDTLRAFLDRLT